MRHSLQIVLAVSLLFFAAVSLAEYEGFPLPAGPQDKGLPYTRSARPAARKAIGKTLVFFPGTGSELYRGLGAVVLGGLVVSTVFTLVLVPTLFSLMMDARGALGRLLLREKSTEPVPVSSEPEEMVAAG